PFTPGAIVKAVFGMPQGCEGQRDDRSRYARSTACNNRPGKIDPRLIENPAQAVQILQFAVFGQSADGNVACAGHMAGSHAGARFGIAACEPSSSTCIGDLRTPF